MKHSTILDFFETTLGRGLGSMLTRCFTKQHVDTSAIPANDKKSVGEMMQTRLVQRRNAGASRLHLFPNPLDFGFVVLGIHLNVSLCVKHWNNNFVVLTCLV